MEYRKRTRSKRKSSRAQSQSSGGKVVLVLVLIGLGVYLVSATAVGTWLAENIVEPVFAAFNPQTQAGTTDAPLLTTDEPAGSQAEAVLEGLTAYMLQMGVFSSEQNAAECAASLQSKGEAGYVMEDGESYRVFAATYDTKSTAQTVRNELKDSGLDTALHELSRAELVFSVTAQDDAAQTVGNAFAALSQAHDDMAKAVETCTSNLVDIEGGKKAAQTMLDNLLAGRDALSVESEDTVLREVLACFDEYCAALETLANYDEKNTVDFSSKMKYTQIKMIDEYVGLLGRLAG